MADIKKAVAENVSGKFFVDETCIDCDTCRQIAPETFDDAGEYSYVHHQPETSDEERLALRALLSCPTGSIGTQGSNLAKQVMTDFPVLVDDDVYYCGFTSPKSFGGSSYFIRHANGNWLVDSPKYLTNLVEKFKQMGGIQHIFLTHSDDVGDVDKYADMFDAERIIHAEELWSQPESERVIEGEEPIEIYPGFWVIPTPGHTKGHCVMLYNNKFLFTGDHMWWDRENRRLGNPQNYYWNKNIMADSNSRLRAYEFEWVLPGHGQRIHLPKSEMKKALTQLIEKKTVC